MKRDFYWKRIVLVVVIWLFALYELGKKEIPVKNIEQIKAQAVPAKECM